MLLWLLPIAVLVVKYNLKTQMYQFESQSVETKDFVVLSISHVGFAVQRVLEILTSSLLEKNALVLWSPNILCRILLT